MSPQEFETLSLVYLNMVAGEVEYPGPFVIDDEEVTREQYTAILYKQVLAYTKTAVRRERAAPKASRKIAR